MTKPPGRPRRTETSAAITKAALHLLEEEGYGNVTIEEVAKRAKVSRPTVYRRFSSKETMLAAAIEQQLQSINPEIPRTKDANKNVRITLYQLCHALESTSLGPAIAEIIGPAKRNVALQEAMHSALERRREHIRSLLRAAKQEERLLCPVETGIDLLLGAIYLRYLLGRNNLTRGFVDQIVATVVAK